MNITEQFNKYMDSYIEGMLELASENGSSASLALMIGRLRRTADKYTLELLKLNKVTDGSFQPINGLPEKSSCSEEEKCEKSSITLKEL